MKLKLATFILVILTAIALSVSVFKVRSNSMSPNYNDGDYVLVLKKYFFNTKPNDVVLFKRLDKTYMKRIKKFYRDTLFYAPSCGYSRAQIPQEDELSCSIKKYKVPNKNDKIEGSNEIFKAKYFIEKEIGRKLYYKNGSFYLQGEKINTYTIQNNFYFVEGDNKRVSLDSRKFGPIIEENIRGKVLFKLF